MSEGRRIYSEKGEINAESCAGDRFEPRPKAYRAKVGKDGGLPGHGREDPRLLPAQPLCDPRGN